MEIKIEDLISVLKIIIIDILLSGDNAIVIAMATLNLDPENRRKGIILGTSGAIVLRVLMASIATYLLAIPFFQLFGGFLLIWVTIKLLNESSGKKTKEPELDLPTRLLNAIKLIIIADFSMSTDNILAIGGASHGNVKLLIFGLLFSIPILMFFSQKIASYMDNYPVLVSLGAIVLGMVAGEVIFSDKFVTQHIQEPYNIILTILIVCFVFATSKIKIFFI